MPLPLRGRQLGILLHVMGCFQIVQQCHSPPWPPVHKFFHMEEQGKHRPPGPVLIGQPAQVLIAARLIDAGRVKEPALFPPGKE